MPFQFQPCEQGCAIISCNLAQDTQVYFIVGTAFIFPMEPEPSKGRILIFCVKDGVLHLVSEFETKGTVYTLNSFNGKLLASITSKIVLFDWIEKDTGAKELILECAHRGHLWTLSTVCRGHFVLVGDLMKSVSLLLYKTGEHTLEEIARDYNPAWTTSIEALDDDTFLVAENSFNLFTVKKNSDAATDEERAKLEICGQYHLGEFVNKFQHGSLVMKLPESEGFQVPTLIYGTVSGAIGVIASLSEEHYKFFSKVQTNLTKVIRGVGGLVHESWRSFSNERKTVEAKAFLDGDLIESFLELKPDKMKEVIKGLDVTVEELCKRIETLQRAIH